MVALVAAEQVDAFASQVASVYHTATGIMPEIYPARPAAGAGLI
jgi:galactokinase